MGWSLSRRLELTLIGVGLLIAIGAAAVDHIVAQSRDESDSVTSSAARPSAIGHSGAVAIETISATPPTSRTKYSRVHALQSGETVFAYSRISPDGHWLAYTSQRVGVSGNTERTVKVIDLRTGSEAFSESGLDPYWSPKGDRLVFVSSRNGAPDLSILHIGTKKVVRGVGPRDLGDYPSWGADGGADVILTIRGHYFSPASVQRVGHRTVQPCPGVGVAERPLISRDGRRITAFAFGTLVVRNLRDCDDVIRTEIEGAKADFSADGRYIAYHTWKPDQQSYAIQIADLKTRETITVTDVAGRSYFPSWTDDGRLCFRHDAPDFKGFVIASGFLANPRAPFPSGRQVSAQVDWPTLFGQAGTHGAAVRVGLVWAPWISHSPDALRALQAADDELARLGASVDLFETAEPAAPGDEADSMRRAEHLRLPTVSLHAPNYHLTFGHNQLPVALLFVDGKLARRHLGAMTAPDIVDWVLATGKAFGGSGRRPSPGARH